MPITRPPALSAIVLFLALLGPAGAAAADWIYVVAPGDNLWQLCEKYLGGTERVADLQRLNGIAEPRRMPPGINLRVPMAWIPPSAPVSASVLELAGSATLFRAAGGSVPAVTDTTIQLGDRLRTDTDSSLAVRFADGSVLTVHADSEIRFDQLSAYGETGMVDSRAKVIAGRAEARVESAVGPGSRFEIATPSAISAVRGTEYRAAVSAEDAANIEVLEGSVAVTAQAQKVLVPEGFGTQVTPGAPPMPARALLAAPSFQGTPKRMADGTVLVRWGSVPGAGQYRLETSRRADFATVDQQQLTTDREASLSGLTDGMHYLRVVALDELGLAGFPALTTANLVAATPAPTPKGAVVVPNPTVGEYYAGSHRVTWPESPGYRYQVQVDRSTQFGSPSIDIVTSDALKDVPRDMTHGRYVRVRVLDGDTAVTGWSKAVPIEPALRSHYWPLILTPLLLLLAI